MHKPPITMHNFVDSQHYKCTLCNYQTQYKHNFTKHCTTSKHIEKMRPSRNFICTQCNKPYKYKSGLTRHKKKCDFGNDTEIAENQLDNFDNSFKQMVSQLMNENRELHKTIIQLAKEPKIVNNNQTITRTKNFNIINFLNTDCKDAFNLSEFIRNLKVTFNDLHYIKEHGYLQGIKDSLIKSLSELAEEKRPIHCTDLKRRHFYVKNNDAWDKDKTCDELNSAINTFNHEQLRKVVEWKRTNPNEEELNDTLNIITKEITTMYQEQGNKLRTKILNEIGNATIIQK